MIIQSGKVNLPPGFTVRGMSNSEFNPVPQPTPQVEAQLDSAMFSMEALENTVAALISRLEPVTGCYPEEAVGANAASMLVPVAARISHFEERVRNCEARLSRALGALQI